MVKKYFLLLAFLSLISFFNFGNELKKATKIVEEQKCIDCHKDLIARKEIHAPSAESCDDCHLVNLKDHTENGKLGLNLSTKVPELCFSCHADMKNNLDTIKNVHQAINMGKSCINCHSPHSSDQKMLLVSEEKKLCLSCHNKDVNADGKKVVNIQNQIARSKSIHPPLESDGCVICHQPHGSSNNYLLKGAFPKGIYAATKRDNFSFCWECHDSDLLQLAVTASKTNFRNGATNLHYLHRTEQNGRTCIVCHNIHASGNLHLIQDKIKFGQWELKINYKPNEKGGTCFPGCHTERSYTR